MTNDHYVVIVGCGRVGSILANKLSAAGNSLVVIDIDESTFDDLSSEFSGFRLAGDATQIALLREAKLQKADTLIATTHDDNVNLMVAQVARNIFKTPLVMARVYDPKREQVYQRLGIRTICPTAVAASLFMEALAGETDRDKESAL
ncbi:TrkA family potassium uptake protein [Pseudodesulfovibrio sp.]|uniref:potassium channel family protein n=1 Tax=Pseudodesulfovibrio sp. TaxID=2035812 RepID=UPI002630AEEF|nr:TrkA family potassium uptake protein [Pseudodesulfovibrio sp.]MDD3312874.1 TrkA family potassium uptake protein [Pseudodesulfovibrio sp.]